MEHLRDAWRSLRVLRKEPTFAATVLSTLALCLGANVAIFGVVHAVLLEPLPFEEPDRLVTIFNSYPRAGAERGSNGTFDFFERRENVPAFEEVAIYDATSRTVGEPGSTERVTALFVTPAFFPLLGVEAALGRTFLEEEMEAGAERKVVLSHGAWMEWFGGAASAVGTDLRVDGRPYTIVGVLGEDFTMPDTDDPRIYVPIALGPEDRTIDNWHSNNFSMIARLAPGATVEQAVAQNAALNDALIDRWNQPNARQLLADVGYRTVVVPTAEDIVRDVRPLLHMLWAGVVFVLLIGCVNVANLVLARAETRLTEMATRLAIGASRRRVAATVLTESVALALLGGLLGLGLGALGLRWLESVGATDLPRGTEIAIDGPVVAFGLALAVAAGALFAALPMAAILRGDLSPAFRGGGRTGTASRRSVRIRNGLVTAQVGLAFVLLIGAGLMLMSFRSALAVDPGIEPEGVLTGFVSLPEARYGDPDARRRHWDELLAEVRALPGVAAASVTSQLPFTGNNSSSVLMPEGYVPAAGESLLAPRQHWVGPDYFDAMGIELLEGRDFTDADAPGAVRTIILDEWLANRYFPRGGALGSRMVFGQVPGTDSIPEESLFTVVGVVESIRHDDVTAPESEHVGAYYFTYRQQPAPFMTLVTRVANGDPADLTPQIREILARLDPELPFFGVATMAERVSDSLASRRIPLLLLSVFAVVSVLLAMVGIYGALAYGVAQRRREIGIRMAMGSAPDAVFRTVLAQGLKVTGIGLLLGGAAAWLLGRLMQSLLFGVQATDLRVIGGVALLLAAVAALACALPARRATRVNPVEALGG